MQRSSNQSVAPLFDGCLKPSSFPAAVRRAVIRSTLPMMAILLASFPIGFAGRAHAQPAIVAPSTDRSIPDSYAGLVHEAAQRFGIPASWIGAVMAVESGGDVLALSPQGAMGLMQIMPGTWATLRARYGLGANPYDPRDNILAGAAYLREMHDRYGSPGFLAAYNAGPGRYDEYLATGRPLPAETQLYVAKLVPLIGEGQVNDEATISQRAIMWQNSPLFAYGRRKSADMPSSFPSVADRTSVAPSIGSPSALAPQSAGLFVRRANAKGFP